MKNRFLSLGLAFLLAVMPAFAAGTVTQAVTYTSPNRIVVTVTWVADASDGSVPNATISFNQIYDYFLSQVETNPGATAPTDNYDITILNAGGADLMAGTLADRDTSTTELAYPANGSQVLDGPLTLTLSGNSVNSATGTAKLYFTRVPTGGTSSSSSSASTVDPTHAGLTYTTAQTNAVLIAAPSAGNRIVVLGVWVASSVTANVSVLIGFHATVTPATGTGRVFSHPAVSLTGGGWKQLGGSAIGVGGDAVPLLITTGTTADGAIHVDVDYIVEAIP